MTLKHTFRLVFLNLRRGGRRCREGGKRSVARTITIAQVKLWMATEVFAIRVHASISNQQIFAHALNSK